MFISVDLPEPDGPMIATYSLRRMSSVDAAQRLDRLGAHLVVAGQVADPDDGLAHDRFASFLHVRGLRLPSPWRRPCRSRIAW